MNNKDNDSSSGMGLIGVVQVVFIILKLLKVINWSWWTVLIPLWINIVLLVIFIGVIALADFLDKKGKW